MARIEEGVCEASVANAFAFNPIYKAIVYKSLQESRGI